MITLVTRDYLLLFVICVWIESDRGLLARKCANLRQIIGFEDKTRERLRVSASKLETALTSINAPASLAWSNRT